MYQQEIKLSYGEGKYRININALVTADGISVNMTGGEKPHVGGVALSVPRPSLANRICGDDLAVSEASAIKGKVSCDTWLTPVPGHKDIHVAGPASEQITRATGEKTVVVAGVHIDNASPEELQLLLENAQKATGLLLDKINNLQEKS